MLKSIQEKAVFILVAISGLVLIATPFIGLSKLSAKSKTLVGLKLQSKSLENQESNLQATKKQLSKYSYFNSVAKTVIPNDKDEAPAVIDIYQKAKDSGIALAGIAFPASNLGKPGASATGSATISGSSVISTAPSQTKPVTGIPGLYSLELTITPQVGQQVPSSRLPTYAKFIDFLTRVERDRRTAQITQISINPTTAGLNFTLVINIFIKP